MSELTDFLLARFDEDEADMRESRIGDMPEWWSPDAWSRERGLAEIDVKRSIVWMCHAEWTAGGGYDPEAEMAHAIAKSYATLYASHPDFREEWVL